MFILRHVQEKHDTKVSSVLELIYTIVTESMTVQDNGCCDVYIKACPGETRLESKCCIRLDMHHSYRIYDSTGQWML